MELLADEFQEDIIAVLKTAAVFNDYDAGGKDIRVKEYEDEFAGEPDEWGQSYPCCLVQYVRSVPRSTATDGSVTKYDYDFTIFIAQDKTGVNTTKIKAVINQVQKLLNGLQLFEGNESYRVQIGQIDLHDRNKSVECYLMDIGTIPG